MVLLLIAGRSLVSKLGRLALVAVLLNSLRPLVLGLHEVLNIRVSWVAIAVLPSDSVALWDLRRWNDLVLRMPLLSRTVSHSFVELGADDWMVSVLLVSCYQTL